MLQAAIESVLNQTHREIEVIVVDDASTDGTKDYLTELAAKDRRVKFLANSQSKGACVARNMAIKQAQGVFVTGLDDDDEFEPFHIESLVSSWRLLEKTPLQFSALYFQYKYKKDGKYSYSQKLSSVSYEDLHAANHIGNQIFSTRERFIEAGLFDESMPAWQDLEFFYRFLKHHGPARLVDVNSYIFDITPRGDRISTSNKLKILNTYIKFITIHNLKADSQKAFEVLGQVYSSYYGYTFSFSDVRILHQSGISNVVLYKLIKRYCLKKLFLKIKNII
jgi:glycosyltransferase involved in cell wall biosynthesis